MLLIILFILIFVYLSVQKESWAASPGTLLQLVSSRPYPYYWSRGSFYTPHYRMGYWPPIYAYDHIPRSRHSYYYHKYSPLYY